MCPESSPARSGVLSVHLVDTSVATSLRRRAPNPAEVAGLRSVRKVLCAPFEGGAVAAPQPSRGGIIAFWDDNEALDDFCDWHPAASYLNAGWMLRMQPLRASGAWPGLSIDVPAEQAGAWDGPMAVLTIGNVKPHRFGGLQRHTTKIEQQLAESPGFLWGTGLAGPRRMLATLSLFESKAAMSAFAHRGAHRDGVNASVPDPRPAGRDPFRHGTNYFSEAAFIQCRPFGSLGHLSGRNPQPAFDFPQDPLPSDVTVTERVPV